MARWKERERGKEGELLKLVPIKILPVAKMVRNERTREFGSEVYFFLSVQSEEEVGIEFV